MNVRLVINRYSSVIQLVKKLVDLFNKYFKLLLTNERCRHEMVDAICQVFVYSNGGPGAIIHLEGVLRIVREYRQQYTRPT